jgi:hypothetical protein
MTHYFTGTPCKRGHLANRLLSDRSCVECNKEKRAKYYKENPEKYREVRRQAYAANPDKERETAKIRSIEWRKLNPNHEGVKASKKKWKINNIGKVRADTAKRRIAKLNRTPKWLTAVDFERIENEYKLAAILTKLWGEPWHVDHVIPLQGKMVSGLHVPSNLQVLRGKDNIKKANGYLPK